MFNQIFKKLSLIVSSFIFVVLFQNCENFGSFIVYDDLAALDPHADSWQPVEGLEVKDGDWAKSEAQVEEKLRLTDRNFITTKLMNIFASSDENTNEYKSLKIFLDSLISANRSEFGGSCLYSNPESITINDKGAKSVCKGTNENESNILNIPSPNVFRAALKHQVCDTISTNQYAMENFKNNITELSTVLKSENEVYLAHQLFYLGQQPRKRTLASLNDLYKKSSEAKDVKNDIDMDGLKILSLALCLSNGWEVP